MVEALDVDAIQKVWNEYFVFLGVEQVKRGDEAEAVVEATSQREQANAQLEKDTRTAQRAFDSAKLKADNKHTKQLSEIESALQGVRDIAIEATQATKDHQDRAEKELGVRPHIPQGAPTSGVRRTAL